MMRFALTKCDVLTVLICCSNKENISSTIRKEWIDKTFADEPRVHSLIVNYNEDELPNTSVSSKEVSAAWATEFKKYCISASMLVTSEPYGEYVAEYMNIQHILFDKQRTVVPISASEIKKDVFANWKFLPESVKPFYAVKIVIAGTESTGKSTLTKNLAAHYNCAAVFEAGRDLIPDSNNFVFEDLQLVAAEHAKRINVAAAGNSPLIIIDTDIHITKSYAQFVFKKKLPVSESIYKTNKAALYLYLDNAVSFVQDGTRLYKEQRNLLDSSHRQTFETHNISVVEIGGNWQERFSQSVKHIDALIASLKINE